MMRRVLLTGGDGFVGRAFQNRLRDDDVTVVDLKRGTDCRDFFKTCDERYDLVIHLAAIVGGRLTIEEQPLTVASDLAIDADFFNWAARTRQHRVVYFSSSAAYPVGLQTGRPPHRLREADIDPELMGRPDMTYGWAKLTGEVLAGYARRDGMPVHVLRPFSGYGTDQDSTYPFPSFIHRGLRQDAPFTVWGTGEQVRDFIHIRDVVEATMAVVDADYQGPVNLCTGEGTSFNDLARLVMSEVGYEAPIHNVESMPEGCRYRVGDPSLMFRFWEPRISLAEGVRMALRGVI